MIKKILTIGCIILLLLISTAGCKKNVLNETISETPAINITEQSEAIQFDDEMLEKMLEFAFRKDSKEINAFDLESVKSLTILGNTHISINEIDDSWYEVGGSFELYIFDGKRYRDQGELSTLEDLKKMPNLRELTIRNCIIDNPEALNALIGLETLSLTNCGLENADFLKNMQNLTQVNLNYNKISNIDGIGSLENLVELHMYFNKISDITALKGLINLKKLDLSANDIEDISVLEHMPNLKILNLFLNEINDISVVRDLPGLIELDLWSNNFDNIEALEGLSNLQSLFIGDTYIESLEPIRNLVNLRKLGVEVKNHSITLRLASPTQGTEGMT